MRTTVDIPDDLYRQAETVAASRGIPVRELIVEALRLVLTTPWVAQETRRVRFPLIRSVRSGSMSVDAVRRAEEQSFVDEDSSRGE
jgi:metal-responsive CopG/Arc/MetJ family transcriptional regulator